MFDDKLLFGKHMCQIITLDEKLSSFKCEVCEKELPSRRRLLFHHQFHIENPRPKICLICLESFTCDINFYNHVNFKHEDVDVFFCRDCDWTFTNANDWETHRNMHMKVRMYVCESCEKSFIHKESYNRHLVTHSSTFEFVCNICKKGFRRKSRLKKHLTTHDKPTCNNIFACDVCNMAFRNTHDLIDHFLEDHNQEINDEYLSKCKFTVDRVFCCQYCERYDII